MQKLPKEFNNFLVTGATGFIGSALVRELIKQKKKVTVIVRNKKLNWRLQAYKSNIKIVESDITNPNLTAIFKKIHPDYIFHTASYGTFSDEKNTAKMIAVNIQGTLNILNAFRDAGGKMFINTGSSSEYGSSNTPHKETDTLSPINDYAVTKSSETLFCQKYALALSLPVITLRLFSPFGYFDDGRRLVPWILLHCLKNNDIPLSNPKFVRDFIFIDDVIDGYFKTLMAKHTPGSIYNIGGGREHAITDIIKIALKNTTAKPLWHNVVKQDRQDEPAHWQADITKAKKFLNWKPETTLEEGIKKTKEWFQEHTYLYE